MGTPPPTPTIVYVKWWKQRAFPSTAKTLERVDYYNVAMEPSRRLEVGTEVKLLLLSRTRYHSLDTPEKAPVYDAYDIQVEGRIDRFVTCTDKDLTLSLTNRIPTNPIRYAYITLPYPRTPLHPATHSHGGGMRLERILNTRTPEWPEPNAVTSGRLVTPNAAHPDSHGHPPSPVPDPARTDGPPTPMPMHPFDIGSAVHDIRKAVGLRTRPRQWVGKA